MNEAPNNYKETARRFDELRELIAAPFQVPDPIGSGPEFAGRRAEVSARCKRIVEELPKGLDWFAAQGESLNTSAEVYLERCGVLAADESKATDDQLVNDMDNIWMSLRYELTMAELNITRRLLGVIS